MLSNAIRVLIVDDSALARNFIMNGLSAQKGHIDVIGTAVDAQDAKTKILALNPDVVTIDVEMPGMNGIDFVKSFLPEHPIPVILVSSLNIRIFEALQAGAVDFVKKPDGINKNESFFKHLTEKIVVASCANIRKRGALPLRNNTIKAPATSVLQRKKNVLKPVSSILMPDVKPDVNLDNIIIAIGASAGGTEATTHVLNMMPSVMPPIIVVQHMPAGFTKMYADALNRTCALNVFEAEDGLELKNGCVFVAPAEKQTRITCKNGSYYFSCEYGEKVSGHRPSVDALFHSMASNVKCRMIGVILTGMGSDGAKGLLEMRKKGAQTIGQNEETCVVYGMPKVAYNIGAVEMQVSKDDVARTIIKCINT